jgi:tetratricopeptide (TPR) repeat protein
MDRNNIPKLIEDWQRIILKFNHQDIAFNLAICYTKLEDFIKAKQLFEKSCVTMLQNSYWKLTGQTDWLVDVCVLSNRPDLFSRIWQELEQYQSDYRGNSPMANSSYALMELLEPIGWDIQKSIQELFKRPRFKDMIAFGKVVRAIVENDNAGLSAALEEFLKIHAGKAKHGILRESPEGLLSMSAMSLMYAARKKGIHIEIENEYISNGYLEYLLQS